MLQAVPCIIVRLLNKKENRGTDVDRFKASPYIGESWLDYCRKIKVGYTLIGVATIVAKDIRVDFEGFSVYNTAVLD